MVWRTLLLLLVAISANAATYKLQPKFVGAFSLDGTFSPIPNYFDNPSEVALVQVDFLLTFESMVPNQAFGSINFDINFSDYQDSHAIGWAANNPTFDFNGAAPGGVAPLFAINEDSGDPTDFKSIQVSVHPALHYFSIFDGLIGTGPVGTLIGSVYLETSPFGLYGPISTKINSAWYRDEVRILSDPFASLHSGWISYYLTPGFEEGFDVVPEPSSAMLIGFALCAFGVGGRRG